MCVRESPGDEGLSRIQPQPGEPMPKILIALVRHGAYLQPANVPSAHLPHPLDESGRKQALQGAETIGQFAHEAGLAVVPEIDSSPLLRAWQSATIVSDHLRARFGTPFRVREIQALCERSLGSAANLTMAEIAAAIGRDPRYPPLPPKWKQLPDFRLPLPGAESLMESGQRAARHIETEIAQIESACAVPTLKVFVGHGGAFRHAAVHLGFWSAVEAGRHSMYYGAPVFLEKMPDGHWILRAGKWKTRSEMKD